MGFQDRPDPPVVVGIGVQLYAWCEARILNLSVNPRDMGR
jgi:hypothetical protein